MSAFIHLYLGHLFGDYVLQNAWIAINKGKKKRALCVHILLIFVSQLFFIIPKGLYIGSNILAVSIVVAAVHCLIDAGKIKFGGNGWKSYLLDQALHLVVILSLVKFLSEVDFLIPDDIAWRLAIGIFNAYFLSILFYMMKNDGFYKRDWLGYLYRFLLPWFSGLWFLTYALIGFAGIFYHYKNANSSMKRQVLLSSMVSLILTLIWEVVS